MKKVLIALLFSPMLAMAVPTELCVARHFAAVKNNPGFGYEKDREVVRAWCQCKWLQEQEGKSEVEAIEFCVVDTLNVAAQERHHK